MLKSTLSALFAWAIPTVFLHAQTAAQVVMVDVSDLIWYVLPFCLITFAGLACFLQKLLRPKTSSLPMYISAGVGVLWAGILAMKFYDMEKTQIGGKAAEPTAQTQLSETAQAHKANVEAEHKARRFGNFYTIAAPNLIFLCLGLGLEWRRKTAKN